MHLIHNKFEDYTFKITATSHRGKEFNYVLAMNYFEYFLGFNDLEKYQLIYS